MTNSVVVLVWSSNHKEQSSNCATKELLFTPSASWVLLALAGLGLDKVIVHGNTEACSGLGLTVASGKELAAALAEKDVKNVLVLGADAPLITAGDILDGSKKHQASGRKVTLFADREKFLTGAGWYDTVGFTEILKLFGDDFALSDLLEEIKEIGISSTTHIVDTSSILPINSSRNYNRLSTVARERIINLHIENNVDIPISDGIIIGPKVTIGTGTEILPGTLIKKASHIGKNCTVGPNSVIDSSTIGNDNLINSSHLEDAVIGEHNKIGPMARIRPNSTIGNGVKLGNFVEVKNSVIGDKTSVSHLTYVGDSDIGSGCNLGCGVVTVNYDGKNKFRTVIKNGVFIGCNCNLVAPVTVEENAYAAAGTTITEDVPKNALVIGRSRQTIKENWVKNK